MGHHLVAPAGMIFEIESEREIGKERNLYVEVVSLRFSRHWSRTSLSLDKVIESTQLQSGAGRGRSCKE